MTNTDSAISCLLGMAVGDALGLPYEGLTARRAARLLGPPDRYRLLLGHGLVSDDTEHACLTLQALAASAGREPDFAKALARQLKRWLLLVPPGAGLATSRAAFKLLLGFPPRSSGVRSAGNGPAMRSTILGAVISDPHQLDAAVRISTRMTHTDPRAEYGALVIAHAVRFFRQHTNASDFVEQVRRRLPNPDAAELIDRIESAARSAANGESTVVYAARRWGQRGIGGYMLDTVEGVLHACFRHPDDYESAVQALICCGGDADTTAAIAGGIIGARVGRQGIPAAWLAHLKDWPRTVRWMEQLAESAVRAVESGVHQRWLRLPIYGLLPRNLLFLTVVLFHGFRRLLPPY